MHARRSVGGVYGDIIDRHGQPPKPSHQTQHIQKAWDGPVAANQKNLILSRAPSDVDKARLLAAASTHSGDWLHAPPITAVGLRLSDEAVRVAVAHRLGSKACEPHTCVCGKAVDARGLHGLSCRRSAPRQQRQSFEWHPVESDKASSDASCETANQPDAG